MKYEYELEEDAVWLGNLRDYDLGLDGAVVVLRLPRGDQIDGYGDLLDYGLEITGPNFEADYKMTGEEGEFGIKVWLCCDSRFADGFRVLT